MYQAKSKYTKLSRSKIDLFVQCEKCFYLDRVVGVSRPSGPPFTLNSAVDTVLKTEFDVYRAKGVRHPIMEKYDIDAIPAKHPDLNIWRENFKGIRFDHDASEIMVTGAIDDLWISPQDEYIVVDYKSTSKAEPITALDSKWHEGYKRQMEVYQWLLRQNGLKVSDTGYFVYCNAITSGKNFDNKLDFEVTVISYTGNSTWIEPKLLEIRKCLDSKDVPQSNAECEYCKYYESRASYGQGQLSLI